MSAEVVASTSDTISVAHHQLQALLHDPTLPWAEQVCVLSADSRYSNRRFLYPLATEDNLIVITRVRSNRTFFHTPESKTHQGRGRPPWYGPVFRLQDSSTWPPAQQQWQEFFYTHRGQKRQLLGQWWSQLLMRGTREHPMHQHPFDLLRLQVCDEKGNSLQSPMWLLVWGTQRQGLSPEQCYQAYRARFAQEHAFRFLKAHLLWDEFQTPDSGREHHWVRLSCLAYAQLWAGRELAQSLPLPWQRYLPQVKQGKLSPTQVQRDFSRIIRQVGTPARAPQVRGKPPGRPPGTQLVKRVRRPMVKWHPPRCRCRDKESRKTA